MAEEAGAIATARAIAEGRTTARAECEAAIARIEERDGPINAVVVRDFERARAAADAADARIAAGERAPLLGVPMTVKESFDIAGLPTTWGFEEHRGNIAKADAFVVQRLKAAGAVILGKTNVPVALADWQSVNPIYGQTGNPIDPALSPGGSSGGSAAALASGMVPLEFGSDIGGSIRVPSHFCGVWGHKPSFALIPEEGHDFPGTDSSRVQMAVVGPLARNPDDLELAFDLTIGHPVDPSRVDTLNGARILLLGEHPVAPVDSGVRAVFENMAQAVERAGAVTSRSSDLLPDLAAMHDAYMKLLLVALARGAPQQGQVAVTLAEWFDLLDLQMRYQRQWARLFDAFDVVLAPVAGIPAYPTSELPMLERLAVTDGQESPFALQLAWAGLANYTHLPATAFPVGRTPQGLPVGVQAIAGPLQDRTALKVARLVAESLKARA